MSAKQEEGHGPNKRKSEHSSPVPKRSKRDEHEFCLTFDREKFDLLSNLLAVMKHDCLIKLVVTEDYLVILTYQHGGTLYIRAQIDLGTFKDVVCPAGYAVDVTVNLHVFQKGLNSLKDKAGGPLTTYEIKSDQKSLVLVSRHSQKIQTQIVIAGAHGEITEMNFEESMFPEGKMR